MSFYIVGINLNDVTEKLNKIEGLDFLIETRKDYKIIILSDNTTIKQIDKIILSIGAGFEENHKMCLDDFRKHDHILNFWNK